MQIQNYQINRFEGDEFVVAFVPGQPLPLIAAKSGNPNFDQIVAALRDEADSDEIVPLFDLTDAVNTRFSALNEALSDRILVEGGTVYFDGAPIDNAVTKQIVRFLEEDQDFEPLVYFMERVMDNPNEHSREQLYAWLDGRDFSITQDGMIVGYKGVASDGQGGYRSISSGREKVFVEAEDGTVKSHTGHIPNPIGATISMDRNLVQHDPSVGCHVGLHVGTWDYASNFSRGTVLEVHVDPRDVVSVPTDCAAAKVRTCRYTVVQAVDAPYASGLIAVDGEGDITVSEADESDPDGWDF